ncbi:RND family efflux transporter MFP subunit [Chitinivorax tropicus]|uniref:RND family efflux transporter MFP subunit n=1 Tax=Chitinivorax tropicus TaxID=714531 RepID=A0A840MX64_9PROT|nr:efflux RND transporter periplasmic adaptor subunit [Chitinivorax tropicus]MBB5019741.1 RND family efflux transporter MFP subunit [Chitinivorax tropicus]
MDNDISKLKIERQPLLATPRKSRHLGRWIGGTLAVLVVGGLVISMANRPTPIQLTSVTQAYPSQALSVLNATGYVVAQRKASIASKATGRLEWLGVREGSTVKAGELIAKLENADLKANVSQAAANIDIARARLQEAEAELQDAQRAYDRALDLKKQNFISNAELDQVKARLDRAKAGVSGARSAIGAAVAGTEAARVAVANTEIRAPFDGVILTKNANVGDVVAPFSSSAEAKAAVVTMADLSTLEVEADVAESSVGKVKVGMPCEIQLDALPDMRLKGVVASQVPSVDRSKATVMFKIRFVEKHDQVLPEMSAKVAFLTRELNTNERQPKVAITPTALSGEGKQTWLWQVIDGHAKKVQVERGEQLGDLQTIRGPVKPGDKVVNKPSERLKDGGAVVVAEK